MLLRTPVVLLLVAVLTACAGARTDAIADVVADAIAPPAAVVADAAAPAVTVPAPETAAATTPVQLRGEFRQGELIVGTVPPGSRVRIADRELRVAADGTFVFGLDRDAAPDLVLDVVLPDGKPWQETRPVLSRQYNIQRVTGIAERIMNPSAADQQRINAENAQVGQARTRNDDRLDFLQPFVWPATGPITGVYGSQRFYNGVPKRPHYGVDVGVPTGTLVVAPAGGLVTLAAPDMFYSGGTLVIDHGHGVSSTLMHLSELLVAVGDRVERGQPVAKSGASGRASGPHLDWRMNWFGERIDAQRLVPPMPAP